MILAMNLLGWMTLIIGFSGVFSLSVPRWMGLVVMAMGGLSMFASWTHSRARPFEPVLASLVLLAVSLLAFRSDARSWFPAMVLIAAFGHLAATAESAYHSYREREHVSGRSPVTSRAFFWRRIGRHA